MPVLDPVDGAATSVEGSDGAGDSGLEKGEEEEVVVEKMESLRLVGCVQE